MSIWKVECFVSEDKITQLLRQFSTIGVISSNFKEMTNQSANPTSQIIDVTLDDSKTSHEVLIKSLRSRNIKKFNRSEAKIIVENAGYGEFAVNGALGKLLKDKEIKRVGHGQYRRI